MAFQRVFLGHDRPVLREAVDWLLHQYARGQQADLQQLVVVVPGSRAGRRLLELLVEMAEARGLCLTPPLIETVGAVGEQLYRPKRPFATDLVQRLVWADVMRSADPEVLRAVVPRPPTAADQARWLAYGELLRLQHSELAADGLDFADVAARGASLEGFNERPRWQALQRLQRSYLDRLDALDLWDLQTARREAVRRRECHTDRQIVLVGTVDLNVTLRNMLEQVSHHVTSLVFAPAEWHVRFDEHGCLVPLQWEQADVQLDTAQIHVADRPADQADEVVRQLSALGGEFRGDEVVIGVPDEALVPDLERRLAAAGVTARWGPGLPFSRTAPYRLLEATAAFLAQGDYETFAALVRHPDVARWVAQPGLPADWLERLDGYQNEHLPWGIVAPSPLASSHQPVWQKLVTAVQELLGDLQQPPRPLGNWGDPIWKLLVRCFGSRVLDLAIPDDRVLHAVCSKLRERLAAHSRVPPPIMPDVRAAQAIHWLLDEVRGETIPPPLAADSVEMLGWLELPLDDAPVLIVTSFNEGRVPQSLNSDLFMPNALRQRLGLLDNARRYARDAYAVSLLVAARRVAQFVVGRRNHDGDPQAPSRLLFACDAETTVQRARQFFQPLARPQDTNPAAQQAGEPGGLAVPPPLPVLEPITQLSVTAFRDYLGCPYRFYLRHVEHLASVTDSLDEMDGGGFGSLAHEVLSRFGTGPCRDSSNPDDIAAALNKELDRCVASLFGRNPLPAVLVQVEQLRWRLHAFAVQQAAWRLQGWQIKLVEVPPTRDDAALFEVDREPFWLTGRIDRIDVHEETGVHAILDYKTSDAGKSPRQTHQKQDAWIDLQLPLYRYLARSLKITDPVRLGYILLPKDSTATRFVLADWNEDELSAADECAREVVRNLRRQKFWPPAGSPPDFTEEFDSICQSSVLSRGVTEVPAG